jgi:2-methylcitrate dehydratase PrpD
MLGLPLGVQIPSMTAVTQDLARFIVAARFEEVPVQVQHEVQRAFLNWLGCAYGGCREVAVDRLLAALRPFGGPPQATLIGRGERVDALMAACVNATGSNIIDFDDTHLRTVIHPTVPVAAALLALAEYRPMNGAAFLHALILGMEAECRIGNAVSPGHYERGWHITATCGVIGAAIACAKALKLDQQRMAWAIGIAATQAAGTVEMLGSMSKSFNMGHAARNGLTSALLAESRFTSSERALEAPRGFLNVLATTHDAGEITDDLGSRWEVLANAYKPYPCGIVTHPVIDACLDLRAAHALEAAQIAKVDVTVNPLTQQLCGNATPRTGLQGKLSVHHCAAVALLEGDARIDRFTDRQVTDPRTVALRDKVTLAIDPAIGKAQARVRITLANGGHHELFVEEARGSLERPLSDADIEGKFRSLAARELAPAAIETIISQCWSLTQLPDAGVLARASQSARTKAVAA